MAIAIGATISTVAMLLISWPSTAHDQHDAEQQQVRAGPREDVDQAAGDQVGGATLLVMAVDSGIMPPTSTKSVLIEIDPVRLLQGQHAGRRSSRTRRAAPRSPGVRGVQRQHDDHPRPRRSPAPAWPPAAHRCRLPADPPAAGRPATRSDWRCSRPAPPTNPCTRSTSPPARGWSLPGVLARRAGSPR